METVKKYRALLWIAAFVLSLSTYAVFFERVTGVVFSVYSFKLIYKYPVIVCYPLFAILVFLFIGLFLYEKYAEV